MVWIVEVKEVLSDGLFQFQPPEVEQRLIDKNKTSFFVKNVSEIRDGRERCIEDARLLLQMLYEPAPGFRLSSQRGGKLVGRGGESRQALKAPGVLGIEFAVPTVRDRPDGADRPPVGVEGHQQALEHLRL